MAPASIKWGVWGGAGEMKLYEQARDAFQAKYPQIKIDIVSTAGFIDFIQKLNTLAAGNQSPDVIMLGGEWVPVYAEQGVLQPLDPFIAKTPGFRKEDYLPSVMEGLSYKGQLWGLPKDVNVNVLYYNKSAFDEAGLDYPNADWTWDNLLAAAQALTKRSGGRTERYGFAAPAPWTFIWQNGGEIFDRDIEPTRVRISEPEAVEALEFYYGLSSQYHVSPTPAEVQQTPSEDLFAAGRLAMFQEGRGPTIPFKSIRDFEWGIAPLPHQKVHGEHPQLGGLVPLQSIEGAGRRLDVHPVAGLGGRCARLRERRCRATRSGQPGRRPQPGDRGGLHRVHRLCPPLLRLVQVCPDLSRLDRGGAGHSHR